MTAPRGRIQTVHLPNGRTLLVLDQMPTLNPEQIPDWLDGRGHLAQAGIVALRFDHPVDVAGVW